MSLILLAEIAWWGREPTASCVESAPQRRPRAPFPDGTADDARGRLDLVGAEDDHDLVDGARADPLEHALEQEPLLRPAEACRRPGCEDDGADQMQPFSVRQIAVTRVT